MCNNTEESVGGGRLVHLVLRLALIEGSGNRLPEQRPQSCISASGRHSSRHATRRVDARHGWAWRAKRLGRISDAATDRLQTFSVLCDYSVQPFGDQSRHASHFAFAALLTSPAISQACLTPSCLLSNR